MLGLGFIELVVMLAVGLVAIGGTFGLIYVAVRLGVKHAKNSN